MGVLVPSFCIKSEAGVARVARSVACVRPFPKWSKVEEAPWRSLVAVTWGRSAHGGHQPNTIAPLPLKKSWHVVTTHYVHTL